MYSFLCRFGDGYTLQAKVPATKTSPAQGSQQSPAEPPSSPHQEVPASTKTSPAQQSPTESLSSPQHQVPASPPQPELMFDTFALRTFIEQTFSGARLMEEHQVGQKLSRRIRLYVFNTLHAITHICIFYTCSSTLPPPHSIFYHLPSHLSFRVL